MLKEKFDGAHEVKQKRKNGRRMLQPKYHRFRPHADTDLVYLATSPDYCETDFMRGSLGTKGRECNPVSFYFFLLQIVHILNTDCPLKMKNPLKPEINDIIWLRKEFICGPIMTTELEGSRLKPFTPSDSLQLGFKDNFYLRNFFIYVL